MSAWSEPLRAVGDMATFWASAPALSFAPRGDGHSVLVIPGFNTNDESTSVIRSFLSFLGYRCEAWELGHNYGFRVLGKNQVLLRDRLRDIAMTSRGKISLVGWSLGGVMARQMAQEHSDLVRQVIMLGSPFRDPRSTSVRAFYEWMSGERLDDDDTQRKWERFRPTPPVPTTSIYTRTDGISAWQNCLQTETETAENIEVPGSHMGLPVNPFALLTIADRLAQPEDGWKRRKLMNFKD